MVVDREEWLVKMFFKVIKEEMSLWWPVSVVVNINYRF